MKRHYEDLLSASKVIEALEAEAQSIYDVIGEFQKGKITVDDIPKCYMDIVKNYLGITTNVVSKEEPSKPFLQEWCNDCKCISCFQINEFQDPKYRNGERLRECVECGRYESEVM